MTAVCANNAVQCYAAAAMLLDVIMSLINHYLFKLFLVMCPTDQSASIAWSSDCDNSVFHPLGSVNEGQQLRCRWLNGRPPILEFIAPFVAR